MPTTEEETQLRRDAVANPRMAFLSKNGHTCVVSWDGKNCFIFRGPDFNAMNQEDFDAWLLTAAE